MPSDTEPHPLETMMGHIEDDRDEQRRLVELAVQQRREALHRLGHILNDAKLIPSLRRFLRENLGDYCRIMKYFGATPQYNPRHPSANDYALYVELQWSDVPIDFGAEDTPPGCFTIPMQIMAAEEEADFIAFPSLFQRCTRPEWEHDPNIILKTIQHAYEHAMHARKRTTQAYRYPWGIQTIYDIEMM